MSTRRKGKAVDRGEQEPLLGASASRLPDISTPSPSRWRSTLFTAAIIFLSVVLAAGLLLALLVFSFKPSASELDLLPRTAFRYTPPESISILNITDDGVLVNVTVRCGIDADNVLGVSRYRSEADRAHAEKHGLRGVGAAWWENLRRWSAHTSLARLPSTIEVESPHILIFPRHSASPILAVNISQRINIPLVANAQGDWLRPVPIIAVAKPVGSPDDIWAFIKQGWASGRIQVVIKAAEVHARLPLEQSSWLGPYVQGDKDDLSFDVEMPRECAQRSV